MEFECDKCGLCCQSLRGAELYKDLDDGSGVCKFFDRETKLCTIYDNRPEKCNVEKMYKYFAETYTYEEYIRLNMASCKRLKWQNAEFDLTESEKEEYVCRYH